MLTGYNNAKPTLKDVCVKKELFLSNIYFFCFLLILFYFVPPVKGNDLVSCVIEIKAIVKFCYKCRKRKKMS